jgi:hypothetical protein
MSKCIKTTLSTMVLAFGAMLFTSPSQAADANPVYKGIACNSDGSYTCGGTCDDGCYCCEIPTHPCG